MSYRLFVDSLDAATETTTAPSPTVAPSFLVGIRAFLVGIRGRLS